MMRGVREHDSWNQMKYSDVVLRRLNLDDNSKFCDRGIWTLVKNKSANDDDYEFR